MTIKEKKAEKDGNKKKKEKFSHKSLSEEDLRAKELSKKISKEKAKITKILKNIGENLLKINESLIENISFMSITLDGLVETIKVKGVVEKYSNGATQKGYKKSVEIDVYNTMLKNYNASMKLLIDLLPKGEEDIDDGFMEFLNRGWTIGIKYFFKNTVL